MNLSFVIPALYFFLPFESFKYSTHALDTYVYSEYIHSLYIFNANNRQQLSNAYMRLYWTLS